MRVRIWFARSTWQTRLAACHPSVVHNYGWARSLRGLGRGSNALRHPLPDCPCFGGNIWFLAVGASSVAWIHTMHVGHRHCCAALQHHSRLCPLLARLAAFCGISSHKRCHAAEVWPVPAVLKHLHLLHVGVPADSKGFVLCRF